MIWNFDYDISAIFVISTLILYYCYRKALPLVYNKMFLCLLIVTELVAVTDIIASVIVSYGTFFSIFTLYFSNILYYIALALTPAVFCNYAASFARKPILKKHFVKYLIYAIPFIIALAFILASPVFHTVFSVSDTHVFQYESFRPVIFFETVFYLLLGGGFILQTQRELRMGERYAIYLYVAISLFGHVYQVYVNAYTQMVSMMNTVGLLIIFLMYQNPDYDRDRRSGMYREMGVVKLKEEDILYGKNRPYLSIVIGNYKELRSVYGEMLTDHVLFEVGKFLRTTFPKLPHFYAHNGRFVCDYSRDNVDIQEYADTVFERFRHPFVLDGEEYFLAVSIVYADGSVPFESHKIMRDTMRIAAEEAVEKGSGTLLPVAVEHHEKALRSVRITEVLKQALTGDNLLIYYQPIYGIKEHRIVAAEALVRLYDKELGLIFPEEFIWKAEENGSILTLGEQVFRKVCQFVQKNNMDALGLQFIEVNLSPMQCVREQLSEEFSSIMMEYGIDPKYIGLEITESQAVDMDIVRTNMTRLSSRGVSFALDDYGTGYSNLVNVLSLPLNIVKIDKSLVWAYFNEGNDLLTRIMMAFENETFSLVVEGVETEEMAEELANLGCRYEQGYFYSKPIPEYAFIKYVTDQHY